MTSEFRFWLAGVALLVLILAPVTASADPLAPFEIAIENKTDVRIGDPISVSVDYVSGSETFGSFKLFIRFDASRLALVDVEPGSAITACLWESFSYTLLPCSPCTFRTVEITAIADIANGAIHPLCFSQFGELVKLNFSVTTDTTQAGSRAAVDFYWVDCTSNTLESINADTTWHARFVYDYLGNDITGTDPNLGGTLPGCIVPGPTVQVRATNFHDGGVAIRPGFGLYGDTNGDGRFNLTDVTYMVAYIFSGGPAPKDYLHGNFDGDDGVTIGDAVFLLHYLFGF